MKSFIIFIIVSVSLNAQNYMNLSNTKSDDSNDNIKVITLSSDKNISSYLIYVKKSVRAHIHKHHTEVIYVISGSGTMTVGGVEYQIKAGDYLNIPESTVHSVVVNSVEALKVLSTQSPQFFGKDRTFID